MGVTTLVTGGARSGKSALAERLTLALSPAPIYIATAEPLDDEMADRIARHQARRGPDWVTHLAPLALADALTETDRGGAARLVDCLTLWLSNLLHHGWDPEEEGVRLADTLRQQSAPVVVVTNEVGAGIVPENALARRFRDEAGRLNQRIAAVCDQVVLTVAGYPLQVKPSALNL